MNKQPVVSVIVPTRNSAADLEACLVSIKRQTYRAIELIVVDRASSDRTVDIAQAYTTHVYDYGPERSAQRNFGVKKATGEYVLIIDSDMELDDGVVAACVTKAEAQNARAAIIPEDSFGQGFWSACKQLERSFYHGIDWIEAARFFDRRLYQELGGYDEAMVSGEDWDLSSRAAQHTAIARIDQPIRHNEGRLSLVKTLQKKFYYAGQFTKYTAAASKQKQTNHGAEPTSIVLKRFGLFFANPQKLLSKPHLGVGMLFMKVCEFGFGALGYLFTRYVKDAR